MLSGAWAQSASAYDIAVSKSSDRSNAESLDAQSYPESAEIYVFVPATDIERVRFYLDDPARGHSPRKVKTVAPYDFVDTAEQGDAVGLSLSTLDVGTHTITAAVDKADGSTDVTTSTFTVESSTLRFEDNFSGSTLNTSAWAPYVSDGHAGNGLRRASAFSVSNGDLVITAKMVNGQIVSGGMKHRVDYKYGRYVFRVRTDVDPTGTMSGVVLTWPKYQWGPEFTENDMYETGAGYNTRYPFRSFIHYGTSNSQKYYVHNSNAADWHTITMDWRASYLRIYRDGNLVWNLTSTYAIPDVLQHVSIQLDARHERYLTRTVRMYVDYIRIYQ